MYVSGCLNCLIHMKIHVPNMLAKGVKINKKHKLRKFIKHSHKGLRKYKNSHPGLENNNQPP